MTTRADRLLLALSARTVTLEEAEQRGRGAEARGARRPRQHRRRRRPHRAGARARSCPRSRSKAEYDCARPATAPEARAGSREVSNSYDHLQLVRGRAVGVAADLGLRQDATTGGSAAELRRRWRSATPSAPPACKRCATSAPPTSAPAPASALIAVARQTLANQERHSTQITGFVAGGDAAGDRSRPGAGRSRQRSRAAHHATENGYAVARAELNAGHGDDRRASTTTLADDGFPPSARRELGAIGALIDEAIQARPELAALDAQLRGARAGARARPAAATVPSLSLVAGRQRRRQSSFAQTHILDNFGNVQPYGGMAWNVWGGVKLTWPMFQGLLTRGQVQRGGRRAGVAARAERDRLVQQVWVAVQQAAMTVRAAQEALDAPQTRR